MKLLVIFVCYNLYFAHWELFVSPYYPELLLQVCHFCNCVSSSASLTSQDVLHQYQITAWLEYLCDSVICSLLNNSNKETSNISNWSRMRTDKTRRDTVNL